MTTSARFGPSLAFWSLAGLAAGTVLGSVGLVTGSAWIVALSDLLEPVGALWMNALQLTVIPLVVTQLLAALVRSSRPSRMGSLGVRSIALFVAFLTVAGLVTVAVTPLLLRLVTPSPEMLTAVGAGASAEAMGIADSGSPAASLGESLVALVPANIFAAAAEGRLLQLLVVTLLFGAAASQLPHERRLPLAEIFRSLAEAMMVVVEWVLFLTPLAVFALLLSVSLETGLDVVGVVGIYVVMLSGLLVVATLALYPLTVALGGTDLRTFARAVLPAQLVAMGTQSSLASLPALVEGGKDHLELSEDATGFVLPLSVATFKLNQGIYAPFTLLFFAHVLGVPVGAAELGVFLAYTVLTSFSVPGVPRGGGGGVTLALLIAMDIPVAAVVLAEAVQTIPDIFMTLTNVTGDMSVATLLDRQEREESSGEAEPPAGPAGGARPGAHEGAPGEATT